MDHVMYHVTADTAAANCEMMTGLCADDINDRGQPHSCTSDQVSLYSTLLMRSTA